MARQSKQQSSSVGPGAASLLLIAVVLCLTVLGILALISARSDHMLSVRNQEMVVSYYDASVKTQQALAEFDGVLLAARSSSADNDVYLTTVRAALPDGFVMDGQEAEYTADAGADRSLAMTITVTGFDNTQRRYIVNSVMLLGGAEWEDQLLLHDLFGQNDEDYADEYDEE